jgi:4-oxalocrotonate tautomerase
VKNSCLNRHDPAPEARNAPRQNRSPERRPVVVDVVYSAMIDDANVPKHDKFQIITLHADGELVCPNDAYLGIDYTPKIIFIQVFWVAGRPGSE